MNRKLVYTFYISTNFDDEMNSIHFRCLDYFKDAFDEADITFIVDEGYSRENLRIAEEKFVKIFLGKKVSFSFAENTPYRESLVFYSKVATKLSENELVFFAHNKGITNVLKHDREQIYTWVIGMYFYSLNFMDEVQDQLFNKKYYCYGPYLTLRNEREHPNKHGWYYIGTYFWVNCRKLHQYMVNENIALPEMGDRFYAEEFLGNIVPTWPLIFTGSHELRYITTDEDYYTGVKRLTEAIYDTEWDSFNVFYNEIVNQWKD